MGPLVLIVVMLSVTIKTTMLIVVMLNVVYAVSQLLSEVKLNVVIPNVVTPNIVAPPKLYLLAGLQNVIT